ncbi:MAG: ERF family protein [Candidatus Pacebacteria bacterium]|nr:ERF family protein [Candidatus Paceibacterota bacterium]
MTDKKPTGLHDLQTRVHVAKNKVNDFGGYNYRTAEGILAAVKAALPDGATIVITDDLRELAGQIFVSSTATVAFSDGVTHSATGHALHPLTKKGMDPSQITGSASSYARKYALGGLMALDDGSADPDGAKQPYEPEPPPPFDPVAAHDRIAKKLEGVTTLADLADAWAADAGTIKEIIEARADLGKSITETKDRRKAELQEKSA